MKIKRYIPLIIICFFVLALLILFLYMNSNIDYERDELLFQGANQSSVITLYIDEGDCTDFKGYKPQLREEVCLSEYENKKHGRCGALYRHRRGAPVPGRRH